MPADERDVDPSPDHCAHCGGYIDAMNSDAIGRFLRGGGEVVWCGEDCLSAWVSGHPATDSKGSVGR